jgi:hypothetical protein
MSTKKRWSAADVTYLKRFASTKRLAELAKRFATDPDTVRAKLAELKVFAKDDAGAGRGPDPLMEEFEAGVKALYKGKWAEAEKRLGSVVEKSDVPELAGRARQFLRVAQTRSAEVAPSEADPYVEAVFLKNQGDLAAAFEICREKGGKDERFLYLAASIHALSDRQADAVKALGKAIEANPVNRVHAFHDPDFAELRKRQEHAHLFGLE